LEAAARDEKVGFHPGRSWGFTLSATTEPTPLEKLHPAGEIERSLRLIFNEVSSDGGLTTDQCENAEKLALVDAIEVHTDREIPEALSFSQEINELKVTVVSHAHYDKILKEWISDYARWMSRLEDLKAHTLPTLTLPHNP